MSAQQSQQVQISPPLRELQRLIQLSDTSLARTLRSVLVRQQLTVVGVVFAVTLLFAIRDHAPWVTVHKQIAIEFFSAVSQSLAALLGVLIVFLTFTSQSIAQRRIDDYRAFQFQIDQLIGLTQSLPPELSVIDETLVKAIDYLVPMQMKDFPIWTSTPQELVLNQLLANFKSEWAEKQQLPLAAHLHLQQILLVLNNMEEILEGFSTLYNRILEMGRFILAIAKLSFLLGVSLLFLLLFGIVELQRSFPDLSLPIIVTLAVWVLIALLELVVDAWFLYENLHGPWSHSLRRWYYPLK